MLRLCSSGVKDIRAFEVEDASGEPSLEERTVRTEEMSRGKVLIHARFAGEVTPLLQFRESCPHEIYS